MNSAPITKRPWFYIAVWLVILLVVYGWQIYRMGGVQASLPAILFDLACVFPILLWIWIAFFAQFVLPVRTSPDRQKIIGRLWTDLFGGHGPALSVENGVIREHSGERLKSGPGVVWLDTASAAVTRTPVRIKQTLGPGVHFIESKEYIAGTVDLHIQSHTIGVKEDDDPFKTQEETSDEESFRRVQEQRKTVTALTRDGIEIVPTITIRFRVDTGFPLEGEPGSRFGFRSGITRKALEEEEQDKEAVRKAILGEGINPIVIAESDDQRRVAWNVLPASLAVDVWREYASKFTLDELFRAEQIIPPVTPVPLKPAWEEIDPLSKPVQMTSTRPTMKDRLAKLLREVNVILWKMIRKLEGTSVQPPAEMPVLNSQPETNISDEPVKVTALQVINEMVNARLKHSQVIDLDDHGGLKKVPTDSPEYRLLTDRGIKVLSVNIGGLRFKRDIEDKIVENWSASWLKNAKAEEKQIGRRRDILKAAAQEKAIRQYADLLSKDLVRKNPTDIKDTLKILLLRTRTIIINNDELRKDMDEEQQKLEDILRWVEAEE
jgi:hypothetical protein